MFILDTLRPYKILERYGIQYTVCRDFDHISRYRNLRQLVQSPDQSFRMITLETPNSVPETGNIEFNYHEVTPREENRIDLIAYDYLGSASYGWVISYYNDIEDGFTLRPGQKIRIPKTISSLMQNHELMQSVSATQLNLGSEE